MWALVLSCWLMAAPEATEALPDRGLLEFLGRFEDAEGNWVDPLSLDTPLPREGSADDDERRDNDEDDDTGATAVDGGPAPRGAAGDGGAR